MAMRVSRRYVLLALAPSALVMLAVAIFPTLYVFTIAFQHYSLTDPLSRGFAGLDNFARLFSEPRFWQAFWRSAMFSAISLAVSLPVGIALGAFINIKLRGMGFLRAVLIVPMVLTPLVIGAVFRFMLGSGGIVDWALGLVGIEGVSFLGSSVLALPTEAFVDAWQWTPFVAIVVAAGLEAVDKPSLEAARLDGATAWQEFRHIALPQIRPLLVLVLLIRLMDSLREFDKVFIMTAGGPGTSTETLPIYLWRSAFQYYDMGYSAAVGIVMLVAISILATVVVRRFEATRGVSA
jgi:multiple sugar transport system permease protein